MTFFVYFADGSVLVLGLGLCCGGEAFLGGHDSNLADC